MSWHSTASFQVD